MKTENPDIAAIYHELSGRYGQSMTVADVCKEMHFAQARTVRQLIPRGWFGATGGLRIKTIAFARQLAELAES